jgi:hypothetical protein
VPLNNPIRNDRLHLRCGRATIWPLDRCWSSVLAAIDPKGATERSRYVGPDFGISVSLRCRSGSAGRLTRLPCPDLRQVSSKNRFRARRSAPLEACSIGHDMNSLVGPSLAMRASMRLRMLVGRSPTPPHSRPFKKRSRLPASNSTDPHPCYGFAQSPVTTRSRRPPLRRVDRRGESSTNAIAGIISRMGDRELDRITIAFLVVAILFAIGCFAWFVFNS